MTALYSHAAVRDRFLASLDTGDRNASADMATILTACGNGLLGMTPNDCRRGIGSTYRAAAKRVLALDAPKRAREH
jgi:hypothetical protein